MIIDKEHFTNHFMNDRYEVKQLDCFSESVDDRGSFELVKDKLSGEYLHCRVTKDILPTKTQNVYYISNQTPNISSGDGGDNYIGAFVYVYYDGWEFDFYFFEVNGNLDYPIVDTAISQFMPDGLNRDQFRLAMDYVRL